MIIETYIVDSFTDEIFRGNPAGVCLIKNKIQDKQMLSIAKELGLSETAFLSKIDQLNTYNIRFFSPKMEIPLCGHATLAAAKVIFNKYSEIETIHFVNIQQLNLKVQQSNDSIVMEFPVYDTIIQTAPRALLDALGIKEIINSEYNEETKILLLQIDDSQMLNDLAPDFEQLKRAHQSIHGVLVTAASKRPKFDFESRYFWPWSGTNEDPVTGATHTFLAKYWSKRLNKTSMKSFQCSERSGFMEVELTKEHTLLIKSKAQIVLKGEIYLAK